jgi:hypothetical protein
MAEPSSNYVEETFYEAPGLEGQDSTKEPRCLACLRTLLPRVGLKEVNTTKQGVKQP